MKGYKHLTAEQRAQILSTYQETWSVVETAARLGFSARRVRYTVKSAGLKPSNCHWGACYRNKEAVLRWADEGVSFCEIGRRIGTTHHKVAAFLRKHGASYTPHSNRLAGNSHWKGGRTVDKDGYVLLKRPDHPHCNRHGYVREHRLVMESVLGRLLTATEVVHHKDKDKLNNAPENLELFDTNAAHLKVELMGHVPQWTEQGEANILEGLRRGRAKRLASSRRPSGQDAPPSQ